MRLFVFASILYLVVVVSGKSLSRLGYPEFSVGKTHIYDASINLTARIPGMHAQVSKRVLTMRVYIYAETENDLVISIQNVSGSGSVASVGSDTGSMFLKPNKVLDSHLKIPIKCVYQDGEIKSYTLDAKESLESQKTKRTVLRSLELYIVPEALDSQVEEKLPYTYNVTKSSPLGNYSSQYVILSSPYNRVSEQRRVFNVSRVDNYEAIPYQAYESHSNIMAQGCPKNRRIDNNDAGCPVGNESPQVPISKAFVQNHNLREFQDGHLVIDSVETRETHVADVYDQNMEISIKSVFRLAMITTEKVLPPSDQTAFNNLNNFSNEINEEEISTLCGRLNPKVAVENVKNLLQELSEIVIESNLEANSSIVGEKLILLRKTLTILKEIDFRRIQEGIVDYHKLGKAHEVDKVKRQIWLDMLPLIGTQDSITFVTNIILENMNVLRKSLSLWEATSMLNALPSNILHPNEQTIHQLSKLLDLITNRQQLGYVMFFSASHIAVARTINRMCARQRNTQASEKWREDSDRISSIPARFRASSRNNVPPPIICDKLEVQSFFETIVENLDSTDDNSKRAIYIEALARTGLPEVLPVLTPYVNGDIQNLTSYYVDYLRVSAIKALHTMVAKYPSEVQRLVKPIFFNQSEPFKIRIPAFSVFIRSNPSLGLLQQVVESTWRERSSEVGSYVTSALETYGNSSLPCTQLLARRIKKVFSQAKRFDVGYQRSKSLMWSIFDDIRGLGFAKYLQYSANDESIIPNTNYGALEYNGDSFRDFIFQYSSHIQGISASKVYDNIVKYLGIKPAESISNDMVQKIFKEVNITNRDQEPWRISLYHKMFYSVSFNYFDGSDANIEDILSIVRDHLFHYMKTDTEGNFKGTLVKLYMPLSYRVKTVGQSYPSRIQFEMENPILTSVKLHIKQEVKNRNTFTLYVQPSIYSSTIYRNQILSLGDCRNIGVYHDSNTAFTFSSEFKLSLENSGKFNISYRFPDIPQKIFSLKSEAGTYAEKETAMLLTTENKVPIKTRPTFFKREGNFSMMGLPTFSATVLTEESPEEVTYLRNLKEALLCVISKYRNSGWRRRSIEFRRVPGSWSENTQVNMNISFSRAFKNQFTYQKTPIDQLIRELDIDQISEQATVKSIQQEGLILYNAIDEDTHTADTLNLHISQSEKDNITSWTNLKFLHKYSLGRMMHAVRTEFSSRLGIMEKPVEGSMDLVFVLLGTPNMFNYNDDSYDHMAGLAILGINEGPGDPFENLKWSLKGLSYHPIIWTVSKKLLSRRGLDNFLPVSHKECLDDIKVGKVVSVACLKAFQERTFIDNLIELKTFTVSDVKHEAILNYIQQLDFPLKTLIPDEIENSIVKLKDMSLEAVYIHKITNKPFYNINVMSGNKTNRYMLPSFFLIHPPSVFERTDDLLFLKATNNSFPATCGLSHKHVLTYDMESYNLPAKNNSCTYLLSAHCVKNKKFAIVVSTNFQINSNKEVRVYVGNNIIILTKREEETIHFNVNLNSKDHSVTPGSQITLLDGVVGAYLVDELESSVMELDVYGAGFRLFYDGRNVLLRVSSRYKGELCGLCGDFDGDDHTDFKGLNGKFYNESDDDFVQTFNLGTCLENAPIVKSYSCEKNTTEEQDQECLQNSIEQRRILYRNLVLRRHDQFCFSIKPLPTCENNSSPLETEKMKVEFRCYPRNDPTVRNKVKEAKTRILRELSDEPSDFTDTVSIAKRC